MKAQKKDYLTRMKELRIIPNFYTSEAYFNLTDLKVKNNKYWIWMEEDDWILFPPLPIGISNPIFFPWKKIWSDFENHSPPYRYSLEGVYYESQFLDWEYIYDPKRFLNMAGGAWEKFRKNSRKWPNKNKGWTYGLIIDYSQVAFLVIEWLEARKTETEDAEIMAELMFNLTQGVYVKGVFDDRRKLVAVNYADENYHYINYRYLVTNGDYYLDEFARLCFYTDPEIQAKNKLVNDGGCLGSAGLKKFKESLQPVNKRQVYSWNVKREKQ